MLGLSCFDQHIPEDATWLGGGVAVEHRYIGSATS